MVKQRAEKRTYHYIGENSGLLFLVDNPKNRQPNMRGTIRINSIYYDISGWFHRKKNSQQQYIALRVKKQTEKPTKGRGEAIACTYKYYLRSNEGKLFPLPLLATRSSDNKPNMRGTLNVDGTFYDLSAWFKSSKNSENKKKFLSLNLTKHDSKREYLLESLLAGDPRPVPHRTTSQSMPKDNNSFNSFEIDSKANVSAEIDAIDHSAQIMREDQEPNNNEVPHNDVPDQDEPFLNEKISTMIPNGKQSGLEDTLFQHSVSLHKAKIKKDDTITDKALSRDNTERNGTSPSTQEKSEPPERPTGDAEWSDFTDADDLPF